MRNAAQHRARASELLRAAGDKGMSRSELQAAMGIAEKTALFYLRTPGLAVKGETKAHELTRWFAPEFAEAAAAYADARNGQVQDRKASRFSAALMDEACAAAIDGRTHEEIAAVIGRNLRTAADVMLKLNRAGRVQCLLWPIGGGVNGKRARYWPVGVELPPLPEKPVRVRVRKSKAKPKELHKKSGPKPGTMRPVLATAKRAPKPAPVAPAAPIVPKGVKVTVCPSGRDDRFTPSRVEPFFSALAPGNYLRTGSAIERAYGDKEPA